MMQAQLADDLCNVWVGLQALVRQAAIQLSQNLGQLFPLRRRQAGRKRLGLEQCFPNGDRIEFRKLFPAAFALLVHQAKVALAKGLRRELHPLVAEEAAEHAVDGVLAFIGLDIDQGAVDVKQDRAQVH